LQKHFIESGFDLKELVRSITRSTAYQLNAIPNKFRMAAIARTIHDISR
jgi:hypothetical protein